MSKSTTLLSAAGMAALLIAATPSTVSASLVYNAAILLPAQGFGTAPRDLSVQDNVSPESGCVAVSGAGALLVGPSACMGTDAALAGNGVINVGGDEPNPLDDNQKYGIPLASERDIESASDIGILFNATEPGGDAITVADITLKFYLNNVLIGSIDGNHTFDSSNPGNGVAGFVFVVAADQQAYVNGLLAQGDIRFALESTLSGNSGGPETYRLVNINAPPPPVIPEPGSLMLLGSGLLIGARRLRQRFTA